MLYLPSRGPKGTEHQALSKSQCIKPVIILNFPPPASRTEALWQWTLNWDVLYNHLGSLLKMQIPAPHLVMLIRETWEQMILRQMVLRADCEVILSLRRMSGRCHVHGSPEVDIGRSPYWPSITESCFPWQVIAWGMKRDFSPQWTFLLYMMLLNSILLPDENPHKTNMKQRPRSKYFTFPLFIFYLQTMVSINSAFPEGLYFCWEPSNQALIAGPIH